MQHHFSFPRFHPRSHSLIVAILGTTLLLAGILALYPSVMATEADTALAARLTGTITAANTAVIPDATVTVVNSKTGIATTVKSDIFGVYLFSTLAPGTYNVVAGASEFIWDIKLDIQLRPGAQIRLDFTLQPENPVADMIPAPGASATGVVVVEIPPVAFTGDTTFAGVAPSDFNIQREGVPVVTKEMGEFKMVLPLADAEMGRSAQGQSYFGPPPPPSRERYGKINDNPVKLVTEEPVSTFSIDVDTGSYANVRRMLLRGQMPPPDAVRVEEMINYFPYAYALPQDGQPFAVHTALATAPWNPDRVLLRVALKGADVAKASLPPVNLVFLVDVSGSMDEPNKLPLLQASLKLLARQMRPQDKISLVVYAGRSGVVLSGAAGNETDKIVNAIDRLSAGGGTAGGAGIELAYQMAREHFIKGGINRILLATDGDFNVGVTNFNDLKKMVETRRKSGVSLSTLGFGTGNYNEHLMEQLADAGNGAYSYIDSLMEAQKVLANEMTSTLATIAKDVKIQIEFNPARVREYRLIGYENRLLAREDFSNDKVDAGDVGAGHTVTALYELTLPGQTGAIEPLRYQQPQAAKKTDGPDGKETPFADEYAYVRLRSKAPDGDVSTLREFPVKAARIDAIGAADADFRLAAAVAGFGQLLRDKANLGHWGYTDALALARSAVGQDPYGYRAELVRLIGLAEAIAPAPPVAEK